MDFELNLPEYKDSEEFDILDPATQEPVGVKLTLARAGSQTHVQAKHKASNKLTEAVRKGARNTAQVIEAGDLDILTACTLGWKFSEKVLNGKKPPEFNFETVRAFYKKHDFIRQAAQYLVQDQEAFRI
ncbi:MAG: hypothetical protein KQJ78_07710 [Deltaproteobacteria bacterium]|nr:hypothetical protein [Deltaproteobacteria bacterium]